MRELPFIVPLDVPATRAVSLYEGAVAGVPVTSKDVLVEVTGLRLAPS